MIKFTINEEHFSHFTPWFVFECAAWWDLINVKTEALKLSRRSPESLAVTVDEETGE